MDTRHEAEVDTALAALWSTQQECYAKLEQDRLYLADHVGAEKQRLARKGYHFTVRESLDDLLKMSFVGPAYNRANYDRLVARITETREKLAQAKADAAPLEAEYNAAPWSRFFLVLNSGGHIHSSMHCGTCFPTTRFSWLPTLSGLTEKDAVDAHGTILCSVCYPSAPVEWTVGKTPEADPSLCVGSGTHDHNSSGLQYYSRRAECNHCGHTTSVTSTGKLRRHKKEA